MRFSILTPSFNSASYLSRAIDSVLVQDYKDWEHIIMDGGSQDGTLDILKKYPHLIWESKSDKGQSDAMNQAFDRAGGDAIIYLNADDELEPGMLAFVAAIFAQHPQLDMVVGNLRINDRGKVSISNPSLDLGVILDCRFHRFPLNPASYVYTAALQRKIGTFPVSNHYTMDYWFLLRAFLLAKVFKAEVVFGTFYSDGSNKSADGQRGMIHLRKVRNQFLRSFFYKKPVFQFIRERVLRVIEAKLRFRV